MFLSSMLNKKIQGFGGITHVLLAMTLFFLMILFPVEMMAEFITLSMANIKYFLVFLLIIAGASLLPDLDNDESTAGYQLGFIGSIIKTFMKTTAYIVYTAYNLKNDKPPKSMHRLLWHTPFISILILLYFMFFMPVNSMSYWTMLKSAFQNKSFVDFIINNSSTTITIIAAYICAKLGSNVVLYWPMKMLPISHRIKSLINTVVPLAIIFFLITIPITHLKYVGIAIGLGYLFHIVGDLLSQGSVPVHWPIPWKGQAWHSPWILGPFQIRTGGIVNTLLNFVLLAINVMLLIALF